MREKHGIVALYFYSHKLQFRVQSTSQIINNRITFLCTRFKTHLRGKHKTCWVCQLEMGSYLTKKLSVQSNNSFLEQRSPNVVVCIHFAKWKRKCLKCFIDSPRQIERPSAGRWLNNEDINSNHISTCICTGQFNNSAKSITGTQSPFQSKWHC